MNPSPLLHSMHGLPPPPSDRSHSLPAHDVCCVAAWPRLACSVRAREFFDHSNGPGKKHPERDRNKTGFVPYPPIGLSPHRRFSNKEI